MELESGTYVPKTAKTVTVWPRPDANGDGPEVFVERFDDVGNMLGRDLAKDANGATIHEYLPPEGFVHLPTREPGSDRATGTYVKVDGRGVPVRDIHGNAVSIRPGSALVINPDGTSVLLTDDYAHVLFKNAHDVAGSSGGAVPEESASPAPVTSRPTGDLFPAVR